jgi:hypothetical protein
MKNIHVIKSDKPSILHLIEDTLKITKEYVNSVCDTGVNIYITNDEKIKEGDWVFYTLALGFCKTTVGSNGLEQEGIPAKKIILTTDVELIKDGVQAIDDTFLEWFIKNPSCEEVGIDLIPVNEFGSHVTVGGYGFDKFIYKIIIPQEPKQEWNPTQGQEVWIKVFSNWSKGTYIGYDVTKQTHIVREEEKGGGHLFSSIEVLPYTEAAKKEERIFNVSMMKQETNLEEAALKLYPKLISDPYNPAEDLMAEERNIFISGAKWQAEKSYTKEEVITFVKWMYDYKADINRVEEWLEQFKK